jgi:monoamine oxidase
MALFSARTDRRTLARAGLAAVGAAALTGRLSTATGSPAAGSRTGERGRVVVLGAGLAGLAAAHRLMLRGYDVTVLEAQERPGGRVQTQRNGFRAGGYAELGAVRIFETHHHTQKYVKEFGLELMPYDEGASAFFMGGRRFTPPDESVRWPIPGLSRGEQPDPGARFPDYVEPGFAALGDINDPAWPARPASARELDRASFDEFLHARGASSAWRDWFYAQNGRIARVNAAAGFAVESLQGGSQLTSIRGGNDLLPFAMASGLGARVRYGSEVVRVAQDDDGVTIAVRDRTGRRHEIRAERCVCALPFAPLRRIRLDAGFSETKHAAIRRLRYMPAARFYAQTRTRFWEHDPLGRLGGLDLIGTDTMAGRVWNTSSQQPDPTLGMLHAYMFDTEALEFTRHGDGRESAMRRLLGTVLPHSREQTVATFTKAWHEDRWAGGGWGWVPPGDLHWMRPAMSRPEGRVHFAGEHTSLWIAWMNGALESAERVVAEIEHSRRLPDRTRR